MRRWKTTRRRNEWNTVGIWYLVFDLDLKPGPVGHDIHDFRAMAYLRWK